jgi:hypothetical protein
MRSKEAYGGWQAGRLRQDEAARLLGVCHACGPQAPHLDPAADPPAQLVPAVNDLQAPATGLTIVTPAMVWPAARSSL